MDKHGANDPAAAAVVFIFFLMLVSGIYFSAGRAASDGDVHHSRHKTYTGGEEVNPPEGQGTLSGVLLDGSVVWHIAYGGVGAFYFAVGKHALSPGFPLSVGGRCRGFCAY